MIDLETGEFIHDMGNGSGIDSNGHFHMRFGSGMSLDTETGETHITSGWKNDDDSSFFGKLSSLFGGDEEE
jgi:hypothetical protein